MASQTSLENFTIYFYEGTSGSTEILSYIFNSYVNKWWILKLSETDPPIIIAKLPEQTQGQLETLARYAPQARRTEPDVDNLVKDIVAKRGHVISRSIWQANIDAVKKKYAWTPQISGLSQTRNAQSIAPVESAGNTRRSVLKKRGPNTGRLGG